MTHEHTHRIPQPRARMPWYRTWTGLAGLGAVAAVALRLSPDHVAHVRDALPAVLLLLCPLMHVFLHGGQGHGRHGKDGKGLGGEA